MCGFKVGNTEHDSVEVRNNGSAAWEKDEFGVAYCESDEASVIGVVQCTLGEHL